MMIDVVENPRKNRSTTWRKSRRYTKKRRKNPLMASLGNPFRKESCRKSSRRRTYRRRRNPGGFDLKSFNLQSAAMVGLGMIGSDIVPMLVRKYYPALPGSGIAGYAVKLGGTFITAYATKMVTKSQKNFQLVISGGIALVLVDLFRQYIAPSIGLSGLGNYNDPVDVQALADEFNLNGYVQRNGISGYVSSPVGAY